MTKHILMHIFEKINGGETKLFEHMVTWVCFVTFKINKFQAILAYAMFGLGSGLNLLSHNNIIQTNITIGYGGQFVTLKSMQLFINKPLT